MKFIVLTILKLPFSAIQSIPVCATMAHHPSLELSGHPNQGAVHVKH